MGEPTLEEQLETLEFREQLERVRIWSRFQRKKQKQFSGLDIKALQAVLGQRDRLRAALDRVYGILQSEALGSVELMAAIHGCKYTGDTFTPADYRKAIHPETPVKESE